MGHPCKFQRVSRLGSVTARHASSGRQPNCGVQQRAPSVVGRAAITLGNMPLAHILVNNCLPIIDTCLNCGDTARQSCAMVRRWRIFGYFLGPAFQASHVQHISDMHSKFALGHIMCGSMVDIQSATAEIRRGKNKKNKLQDKNILPASATQGGHKNILK